MLSFLEGKLRRIVKTLYPLFLIQKLIVAHSNFSHVQGNIMFLDSRDGLQLSINHIYEPLETDFIKKEVKSGCVVLDIGANIGYYTLIMAKLVGENGAFFLLSQSQAILRCLKKT